MAEFEDWPALLRTASALLASTPEGSVRSVTISIPNAGDDRRLLPYLGAWLKERYGVEVSVVQQPTPSGGSLSNAEHVPANHAPCTNPTEQRARRLPCFAKHSPEIGA